MSSRVTAAFALMGLLLSGSWATASAQPAPETAFGPGEQISYEISYLGITGAHATITVGAESKHEGQTVWPIVAYCSTDAKLAFYPVRDKFVTYWDFQNNRSTGHDFLADENRKRRRQRVVLDHGSRSAKVLMQHEGQKPSEKTFEVPEGAGDVAAATYRLRSLPLEVGKAYELPVFTGKKTFVLKARVENIEKIKTELGEKEVFRVRVQTDFSGKFASKRDVFAFITTDEAHVPVRIEAEFMLGSMRADITDFKPGRRVAKTSATVTNDAGTAISAPAPQQNAGL